ncbi:MAG: putative selenate reductase subunit YgfK [Bacteroidales bacterium]|nr:putative selenate reductase subunit YgfK [Bacteroidales bacterium]MBN2757688.1 putative selenate reductase subunit YgfK [Bacteroidales bacterium]
MTDKFGIIPIEKLLQIILNQYDKNNSIFGIHKDIFFKPNLNDSFRSRRFGQLLESPLGVAAGPHSQMAQNIIAAWLTGARFIELKTIQTLDNLEVSKPCIDMQDEGYNCEWSQELEIKNSYEQYLDAWIIIHILKDKFGWENTEIGTIFNMSVGYDYKGILQENVQWFFNKMSDSSVELEQKLNSIKNIYPNIVNIKINPKISDNITLSTMHGCPPEEIEQIGEYLITEKKLHTAIKLNPTLLGKETLNKIIKNSGFDTQIPDVAFEHDIKYDVAQKIIKKLQSKAEDLNLQFSLKLTNTLESLNHKNIFPENEKMMYASGRILHPIAINVAKKLQNDFDGELDISFSAGLDAFNIEKVLQSGLFPATVCTDILKPGGYGRLNQYIKNIKGIKLNENTDNQLNTLNKYAESVLLDKKYQKTYLNEQSIKTKRELNTFDCIHAPCVDTCPTNQSIPDYMYYTSKGEFDKAFEVIKQTNPFPHTTGMVCEHNCQTKCTRINYDNSLQIREIKRFVSENAKSLNINNKIADNKLKISIIGAGPSGLSCAYFLRKAGFDVNIFEEKQKPGGMADAAIPNFRLTANDIDIDIKEIEKLDVKINYNYKVDEEKFTELQKKSDFVYIAVGAQKARDFNIQGADNENVLNPLEFLYNVKSGNKKNIGNNIAIIGGGNTAMDAARTAKRLINSKGKVTIFYRRTIKQMPANYFEIEETINEGIEIIELAEPLKVENSTNGKLFLTLSKMELGEKDASGRARPVKIPNSEFKIEIDTIIPAVGQDINIDFISEKKLATRKNSYETQINNLFIGGDALNGGVSVIEAIGDGKKAAQEIINKSNINFDTNFKEKRKEQELNELMIKKTEKKFSVKTKEAEFEIRNNFNLISSTLTKEDAIEEASRCLLCDEVCNICTTVCPNLAFHSFEIQPFRHNLKKIIVNNSANKIIDDKSFEIKQKYQILHIAEWCNQCGNCETFCPTSGAPYKEKAHLHLSKNSFENDNEGYFYENLKDYQIIYQKSDNKVNTLKLYANYYIFESQKFEIKINKSDFKIIDFKIKEKEIFEISVQKAAEMSVVLKGAASFFIN